MKETIIKVLKENNFYKHNVKDDEYISNKNSNIRAIVCNDGLFLGPYDPMAKSKAYKGVTESKYTNLSEIERVAKLYKR